MSVAPKSLKLYQSNASPNSRRVRLFLSEKNLSVSIVPVDLGSKAQFSDAYRAINSRSQVPTLVLEDGTAIGEVPAIWRYLEEAFPEPPLLGKSPRDQALVTMWERRMDLDGLAAVMEGVRNKTPGLRSRALSGPHPYEQIPDLVTRSELRVRNFYSDLDSRLATVVFVAGDQFSVADITGLVTVDFATKGFGMPVPVTHLALKRWYGMICARASATA
jgi:glutathione S-transferase